VREFRARSIKPSFVPADSALALHSSNCHKGKGALLIWTEHLEESGITMRSTWPSSHGLTRPACLDGGLALRQLAGDCLLALGVLDLRIHRRLWGELRADIREQGFGARGALDLTHFTHTQEAIQRPCVDREGRAC